MSKKLPVAKHLSDSEYRLLLDTHASHTSTMSLEKRKDYTLSDIVKIERNIKENCLNVHYKNGDWWHYMTNRTWW